MILKRGDVADSDANHFWLFSLLQRLMNNFISLCHWLMAVMRFAYWITAADVAPKLGRHSW